MNSGVPGVMAPRWSSGRRSAHIAATASFEAETEADADAEADAFVLAPRGWRCGALTAAAGCGDIGIADEAAAQSSSGIMALNGVRHLMFVSRRARVVAPGRWQVGWVQYRC